jgi:hypothetical protein
MSFAAMQIYLHMLIYVSAHASEQHKDFLCEVLSVRIVRMMGMIPDLAWYQVEALDLICLMNSVFKCKQSEQGLLRLKSKLPSLFQVCTVPVRCHSQAQESHDCF